MSSFSGKTDTNSSKSPIQIDLTLDDNSEDEDELNDVAKAIALSLQNDEDETPNHRVIQTSHSKPDTSYDELIALHLATSWDTKTNSINSTSTLPSTIEKGAIVSSSLEFIDPCPDLHALFHEFDSEFFEGKLSCVEVKWSSRMTLCAGVCSYEGRGGLCSIRLSQKILQFRPRSDLVNTLLHECIHAYEFITARVRDRDGHGPRFQAMMRNINAKAGTNITIYHSFSNEVNVHRTHWWKCNGPCQYRAPYFGVVRRAMNRAPSRNDTWWARHAVVCGGSFIKIKEPVAKPKVSGKRHKESYSATASSSNDRGQNIKKQPRIDDVFKRRNL